MFRSIASIAAALLLSAPALAADAMVTAQDPQGMVDALELAGYEATLETDEFGDPLIMTELGGWDTRIIFYGCDEETHDGCDSIQFSAGFDRASPWTAEEAMQISSEYRFASVRLDEEGDPYIQWDVVTADGIPTKVFLRSVLEFTLALNNAGKLIFAEERLIESAAEE